MYAMDQTSHFEHRTESRRTRWELPRRRGGAALVASSPDRRDDPTDPTGPTPRPSNDDFAD